MRISLPVIRAALIIASLACGGVMTGAHAAAAQEIEVPAWFKNSFLDLRDDLQEARAAKRRLMIYFGQNGCPWCKKLMAVNFRQQDIVDKTRKNFDVIEINILGSREVTWLDGKARSEKQFAALLKVNYTPTLLFLDERGNVMLRLNGYYAPPEFRFALDYVADREYFKDPDFAHYVRSRGGAPEQRRSRIVN
jgi:thioredoxin-related protein